MLLPGNACAHTAACLQEERCKTEAAALEQTKTPGEDAAGGCKRRLRKFVVVTESGEPVSIQRIGLQNCEACYIEGAASHVPAVTCLSVESVTVLFTGRPCVGAIYPSAGALSKSNGRAVAKRFGPVQRWSATYDGKTPAVLLATDAATYTCTTPAPEYRALFMDAQEQVALCHALVQALRGKEGATLGFEGVLAALNRAKAVKGYVSMRDAVLINGAFILGQLPAMQAALGKSVELAECNFVSELRTEVRRGRICMWRVRALGCANARRAIVPPRACNPMTPAGTAVCAQHACHCSGHRAAVDAAPARRAAHAPGPRHRKHPDPRARQPRGR